MATNGKYKNDSLGTRIKHNYEDVWRITLPKRSYTIIRIDGKSFHSYTRGLVRPFDAGLISDMDATAAFLCKNIMGAKLAYVQSDEISVLLTDFDERDTQAWFDNNLQKMATIAASMATSEFNRLRLKRDLKTVEDVGEFRMAMFDARVFQIPQRTEVFNYFVWRQQDAIRNSISAMAQSLYSHRDLEGRSSLEKKEMIQQKNQDWESLTNREKRGTIIGKVAYVDGKQSEIFETDAGTYYYNDTMADEIASILPDDVVIRKKWETIDTPIFTETKSFLNKIVPINY